MKTVCTRISFLFLLFAFSLTSVSFSQSPQPFARVTGTLTDQAGAALGRVQITARLESPNPPADTTSLTASDGSYALSLSPGTYRIKFVRDAFTTREETLTVASSESRTLNVSLRIEPLSSSVIVTGEALPTSPQLTAAPTDAISRQVIDQRQSVSLPDLLGYSAGVAFGRTGTNGGTASLFLNGGNSNFTKVLIDGSPINPPGGAVDFSVLTTDGIDKVEIVRGAESAIYGSDAVSGVVQLFTHRGTTATPAFSIFSEGGGFSTVRGGGQFSGLMGRFDYASGLSYLQTDGQGPNNDFQNRTVFGNFGYSLTGTAQLRLSLRDNSSEAGIAGQTLYTPPSLYQRINQHLFTSNARLEFTTGPHWHHQLMGTEAFTRQHSDNPTQSFFIPGANSYCPQANPSAVASNYCDYTYDSPLQYNRAGFTAQSTYATNRLAATAGYQYEVENVENGSPYYTYQPHIRRNNQAGYLDFRYSPWARLTLDAGVRAEANDYFGTRVVPRAGGSYALRYGSGFWGDTRLRAFYGEGIKEPRFDQLEGTDPCDPGNPALKPESSKNWVAGVDQKIAADRIKVSAQYFYSRFYNIVSFGAGTPPMGLTCPYYYTYFNTDLAFARGVNFAAEGRATRWLFISGNFTYDDTKVVKSPNATDPALIPGNHLIRRPVNSGSITFMGTFRRFDAVFAGYFSGIRTDSDFLYLGYTRNPGYARFDLSTTYRLQRGLYIYARATNLFDKKYQDALGYPALGRDYRIGLRYQFNGRN